MTAQVKSIHEPNPSKEMQQLRKEIEELRTQLSEQAKITAEHSESILERAQDTITSAAHRTGIKAKAMYLNNKQKAAELQDNTVQQVQENPVQSVAIAAVAGMLVPSLLRALLK